MIEMIVQNQHNYFSTQATKSTEFRLNALNKLHRAINDYEPQILAALKEDLNKPDLETYMSEMGPTLEEIRFVIKHLPSWMQTKTVKTPLLCFPGKSFIVPEPYGVAAIFSAWNYPFALCFKPLIGAIAAGNCAIIKPSELTPASSAVIARLIADTFDPHYITVVEGGIDESTELLQQQLDYIFFTGSVKVGKIIMRAAAEQLTPITLELGGKSPCIVTPSANIKLAAKRVASGKFFNAGQTCIAPDYLLVHAQVKEAFLRQLAEEIAGFFPNGDYSNLPRIINESNYDRLLGLMAGEKVIWGGDHDRDKLFIAPTILDDITWEAGIMQDEIFGPILPILTYHDLDSAIAAINEHPKPLACYLFTTSAQEEEKVLSQVSFGGGCINDTMMHYISPYLGFGGVGNSGIGSYHGKHSFDAFTHYKGVLRKSNWYDPDMRYHPYSEAKLKAVKRVLK